MISRRSLYRRERVVPDPWDEIRVPTVLVDVYRPELSAWTFGLNVEYEGHPSEAQVSLTVLCWRIVAWWQR